MATTQLKDVSHLTKFDGTNFTRWQQGLMLILEQHELLQIVRRNMHIFMLTSHENTRAILNK